MRVTRKLAAGLALVLVGLDIGAAAAEELGGVPVVIRTRQRPVTLRLFAAEGAGPHPSVLMLHGQGIAGYEQAYNHYGADLAARGMDAWFVAYYSPEQAAIMAAPGGEEHRALYHREVGVWAHLAAELADRIAMRPGSSGRVGLLGFSNGGVVAAGAAGLNRHIAAAVVFYGGLPGMISGEMHHFPPLLVLHGGGDHVSPVSDDQYLVDFARRLGAEATLEIYPGAPHAFDFDPSRDDAEPARQRAIGFLAAHLLCAPGAGDCS